MHLPAETGDANDIEKAVADFIRDVCPTHPLASHAVNAPSFAGSDDDMHLAVRQDPLSTGVASHDPFAPSVAAAAMSSEANSASDTLPALLTNQLSAETASTRTAESASSPKRDSYGIKSLCSCKRLCLKRGT